MDWADVLLFNQKAITSMSKAQYKEVREILSKK
jgi:hypothetical protein